MLAEQVSGSASLRKVSEFFHFACTSEDINNLAYGMMLLQAREQVMLPEMDKVITTLAAVAHDLADVPMLGRTHGQPATPSTMGKEMARGPVGHRWVGSGVAWVGGWLAGWLAGCVCQDRAALRTDERNGRGLGTTATQRRLVSPHDICERRTGP